MLLNSLKGRVPRETIVLQFNNIKREEKGQGMNSVKPVLSIKFQGWVIHFYFDFSDDYKGSL